MPAPPAGPPRRAPVAAAAPIGSVLPQLLPDGAPTERAALRRWTLAFRDPQTEALYRRDFHDRMMAVARLLYLLGLLIMSLLGFVEHEVYDPEIWPLVFRVRYFAAVPGLALMAPLVFAPRFAALRAARLHELIFAMFFVAFAPLLVLGPAVFAHADPQTVSLLSASVLVGTTLVFFVSHMRFVHATVVSWFFLGAILAGQVLWRETTALDAIFLGVYPVMALLCSMFGSYQLERHRRLAFAQALAIDHERQLVQRLIHNILPVPIADQLKRSDRSIAETFESASVLFADLVGFTELSARLPAAEVVRLLNGIFSDFDALCDRHGVEKIKTIGDAYMVAAGIPVPRATHLADLAALALDMLAVVDRHRAATGHHLALRIGIHTGPVVAGVIGQRKFIYDLWGDTVNTASRMESTSQPGRVQLTAETAALLGEGYAVHPRGAVPVKGKGEMQTCWLLGRRAAPHPA